MNQPVQTTKNLPISLIKTQSSKDLFQASLTVCITHIVPVTEPHISCLVLSCLRPAGLYGFQSGQK